MRLARHVTLPIEDEVAFRDVLVRKIDLDLKKRAYSATEYACRPAIALAAVGKAIFHLDIQNKKTDSRRGRTGESYNSPSRIQSRNAGLYDCQKRPVA